MWQVWFLHKTVLDLRQEKEFQIPLTDVGDTRTWRTCHFQDAFHFNLGNPERTTVPYLYTEILIFVFLAFSGEELTKEQGHLDSLSASPYRLHCRESPIEANLKDRRRKTKQARNITFQSFFRHLTGFEDSKASLTSPWTREQVLNFSNW